MFTMKQKHQGCSTFAVIGSKVIEIDESYAAGGLVDIPWPILYVLTVLSIFGLAVVVFKGRIIYTDDSSDKEN